MMIAVLFIGEVHLICVSILGQDVGRIFHKVKHGPLSVTQERLGLADGESPSLRSARRSA